MLHCEPDATAAGWLTSLSAEAAVAKVTFMLHYPPGLSNISGEDEADRCKICDFGRAGSKTAYSCTFCGDVDE